MDGSRLLVRMPTRARPHQALHALTLYRDMAGIPGVRIEVVIDDNDPTMLTSQVLQRLNALDCIITVGKHRNKIEAVNGGRVEDWDVLLLASDDMHPVENSKYGLRVLEAMDKHWPHLDGAVYFSDGYQGEALCTLPIMGRRLYDQFGYVYHPSYKSLFCDLEYHAVLKAMNRLTYVDTHILIEHVHPIWGRAQPDSLYKHNESFSEADKATFAKRTKTVQSYAQWGWDSPPLWFSILIATMPSRKKKLEKLLDHLYAQTVQFPRKVEIVVDCTEPGQGSIGVKRQRLLEKAKGRYVAFIDDDDWVPHNYCERIIEALEKEPFVDCLSQNGVVTTDGNQPQPFYHSIHNGQKWYSNGSGHFRPPNHLSAVRRDMALAIGFADKTWAEDHDYSSRLYPLLTKEGQLGGDPIYFYWFSSQKKKGE